MKKEVRIKNKFKFNNNILYLIIAIIVVLLIFLGQTREKTEIIDKGSQVIEESAGSGFLEIETFPSDSEIFIDGVSSGKSPITIYNVAVGTHNVIVRKEGYEDSTVEVYVEAGKKSFIEANLELNKPIEEKEEIINVEKEDEILEGVEEIEVKIKESSDKINIGDKFTFYFDFSKTEFIETRQLESDVFSKRFKDHFIFTRFSPVNIKTIDKGIDDIEKEDCSGITGQYEWLYSGQSLCIITKENNIMAIGGVWDDTENAELEWKVLS